MTDSIDFVLTKESVTKAALAIQPTKRFKIFHKWSYRMGYRDALLKVASLLPEGSSSKQKWDMDLDNLEQCGIKGVSEKELIARINEALQEIERRFELFNAFLDRIALEDTQLYTEFLRELTKEVDE